VGLGGNSSLYPSCPGTDFNPGLLVSRSPLARRGALEVEQHGLDRTPTVVLIKGRKVSRTWVGFIKPDDEAAFLDKLESI
jgi:hypothetical protein